MGFNIASILIKGKVSEDQISEILGYQITYNQEVDFEEASSSFRPENAVDIFQNENGTFIFVPFTDDSDLSKCKNDIVKIIISDVSDTYYFEKFSDGKLERKYIYSQGEIFENEGIGIIDEETNFTDLLWEFCDEFLKEEIFEKKFKRYFS